VTIVRTTTVSPGTVRGRIPAVHHSVQGGTILVPGRARLAIQHYLDSEQLASATQMGGITEPGPFVWAEDTDEILAGIKRARTKASVM
jgi:hypothetical protein